MASWWQEAAWWEYRLTRNFGNYYITSNLHTQSLATRLTYLGFRMVDSSHASLSSLALMTFPWLGPSDSTRESGVNSACCFKAGSAAAMKSVLAPSFLVSKSFACQIEMTRLNQVSKSFACQIDATRLDQPTNFVKEKETK